MVVSGGRGVACNGRDIGQIGERRVDGKTGAYLSHNLRGVTASGFMVSGKYSGSLVSALSLSPSEEHLCAHREHRGYSRDTFNFNICKIGYNLQ